MGEEGKSVLHNADEDEMHEREKGEGHNELSTQNDEAITHTQGATINTHIEKRPMNVQVISNMKGNTTMDYNNVRVALKIKALEEESRRFLEDQQKRKDKEEEEALLWRKENGESLLNEVSKDSTKDSTSHDVHIRNNDEGNDTVEMASTSKQKEYIDVVSLQEKSYNCTVTSKPHPAKPSMTLGIPLKRKSNPSTSDNKLSTYSSSKNSVSEKKLKLDDAFNTSVNKGIGTKPSITGNISKISSRNTNAAQIANLDMSMDHTSICQSDKQLITSEDCAISSDSNDVHDVMKKEIGMERRNVVLEEKDRVRTQIQEEYRKLEELKNRRKSGGENLQDVTLKEEKKKLEEIIQIRSQLEENYKLMDGMKGELKPFPPSTPIYRTVVSGDSVILSDNLRPCDSNAMKEIPIQSNINETHNVAINGTTRCIPMDIDVNETSTWANTSVDTKYHDEVIGCLEMQDNNIILSQCDGQIPSNVIEYGETQEIMKNGTPFNDDGIKKVEDNINQLPPTITNVAETSQQPAYLQYPIIKDITLQNIIPSVTHEGNVLFNYSFSLLLMIIIVGPLF